MRLTPGFREDARRVFGDTLGQNVMMYGLLRYSYSNNIGDEIQSVAAERFLPRVDLTIERSRLHWYRGQGPLTVFFNGYFAPSRNPMGWPPPPDLAPIFVSWYAANPRKLIDARTVRYLKQFEPIGCRNLSTLNWLERCGVEAYHSGCLTLTLPRYDGERSKDVFIVDVDPALAERLIPQSVRREASYLGHGNVSPSKASSAGGVLLRTLNRLDSNLTLLRSRRERFFVAYHDERMRMARQRLAMYSKAKLVITSRLHCAMPCLAFGTPVVLLRSDLETRARFAGLYELVRYRSTGASQIDINWEDPEPNPDRHNDLAQKLEDVCREAVGRHRGSNRIPS